MDYYEEPRQYNALHEDRIKFPTRTNLTGVVKNKLIFGGMRERADVNVSRMPY